jgi:zinc protease
MHRSLFAPLLARHVVIVAGLAAAMPAVAAPDLSKTIGRLPPIETFALANGLQVAVLHSDAAPVVSVQVWYHAGSKDEPRDRRGTAHMFEHMMFKGTTHVRPDAHTQSINALGGLASAATDEDATHYVDILPAAYLDYAVELEAERMRNLMFRAPMIDAQREVIAQELREQDASPLARGLQGCLGVAYQKHPYAWTASGDTKGLAAISADDLKKFYDAYYQPGNAMLVVVGKVAAVDVKASAEKWFGAIPKAGEPPRPAAAVQEPPQTARRREVAATGQVGMTLVGWHIPAGKDKDVYALQLASIVLGAYADPAQADAVEAAIFDEVGKLAARGPTGDELRRAKDQMQAGLVFSLESAQGLAEAIGRSWILTGNPGSFLREVDEVEKVSAADVQRVAKQYLSTDHATVVVFPLKARAP